jgi:TatD DNase family protein
MIIDTHCHVDLYKKPHEILRECEMNGITVLAVTNLPSHYEMGYSHILPFKKIRLALGLHPLKALEHEKEFQLFIKNFSRTSYIGEIGLDFSREGFNTKKIQINSFINILKLVSNQSKILTLHSRRAEKEVYNLLLEYNIKSAIFHWYSGPISLIGKIAEAGYLFSVNSAMLNSESGRKIISKIPTNRLLTETDGPFTEVNGRVAKPTDIPFILNGIAKIKNLPSNEINQIVEKNFKHLLESLN